MYLSVRIFVILNVLFQRKKSQDICALMVKHEPISARICGQTFCRTFCRFRSPSHEILFSSNRLRDSRHGHVERCLSVALKLNVLQTAEKLCSGIGTSYPPILKNKPKLMKTYWRSDFETECHFMSFHWKPRTWLNRITNIIHRSIDHRLLVCFSY